jgi:hypothetical protein
VLAGVLFNWSLMAFARAIYSAEAPDWIAAAVFGADPCGWLVPVCGAAAAPVAPFARTTGAPLPAFPVLPFVSKFSSANALASSSDCAAAALVLSVLVPIAVPRLVVLPAVCEFGASLNSSPGSTIGAGSGTAVGSGAAAGSGAGAGSE